MGAYVVSQSHFKITVEDGTMIEVKIDKAKEYYWYCSSFPWHG